MEQNRIQNFVILNRREKQTVSLLNLAYKIPNVFPPILLEEIKGHRLIYCLNLSLTNLLNHQQKVLGMVPIFFFYIFKPEPNEH